MKVYIGKFRFMIWDEELRIVIAQLEQNISLLEALYPVVIAVSVLVGAGLCFLLLLQIDPGGCHPARVWEPPGRPSGWP